MPIPVTCAKCGNLIQAPNHVAGRTLRCFKCLTPFTVPKTAAAPLAQLAPGPVAAFPGSPAAPKPAAPPPAKKPAAAEEFDLLEEPLLLEPEPAAAAAAPPAAGPDDLLELDDIEMLEEEPKDPGKS